MKMKLRKLLFLTVILVLTAGSSVYAKTEGNVYDDASLLTDSEIASLNKTIARLEEMTGWNVYAVTTDDAQGKSSMEYADDFFDEHSPEQEDGIAALIDMDNRMIYLSTCGEAINYLTDETINEILDEAYTDISEGYYEICLDTMIDGARHAYEAAHPSVTPVEAVIAFLVAAGAGVAVHFGIAGKYRMKFGTYKYDFHDFGEVDLRAQEDRFVNQTVTHRRIPKQTSSGGGGGSTTHRSSSGRSHGGGGRSF